VERINWFGIAAIAAILFISGNAFADSVDIDKIVVTASRIEEDSSGVPRQIDVVTQKEMEQTQARNLADAVEGLTPVQVINYGGPGAVKNVRMRGQTLRRYW